MAEVLYRSICITSGIQASGINTNMLSKSIKRNVFLIYALVGLAGCASLDDIYLHDTQLNQAAKSAAESFKDARPDELWQTMLDNVTASAQVEQNILAKSAEQSFESVLLNIENLKWIDLLRCAKGACWSDYQAGGTIETPDTTQEKLEYLHAQMESLVKEISQLEKDIRNPVTVNAAEPLQITSTLSSAIDNAQNEINLKHDELEAVKEMALTKLQTQLDELTAPWAVLFPDNQWGIEKEKIDATIERVLDGLGDGSNLLEYQTAFQIDVINEILVLLSDSGIEVGSESELPQEVFDNAEARFKDKIVELLSLDQILNPLSEISTRVNTEILSADTALRDLQKLLDDAIDSQSKPSKITKAVSDLFNKTDHPTLLKISSLEEALQGGLTDSIREITNQLNIGAAYEKVKNTKVSDDFVSALERDINMSICNQKPCQLIDVINFLKTDKSRIEIIRKSLLTDFRANELAIYNEQLRLLKDELTIMGELASTLQEQIDQQHILANNVEKQIVTQGIPVNLTVFHGMDCLARSAGRTHGEGCAPDTKTARDHLTESLVILAAYFSLNGHIKEQENQQWVALLRQRHRESIALSKIAALSRELLIANGLEGLAAFTEGGVTADQIAGVFRLANTSLLTVIAAEGL